MEVTKCKHGLEDWKWCSECYAEKQQANHQKNIVKDVTQVYEFKIKVQAENKMEAELLGELVIMEAFERGDMMSVFDMEVKDVQAS